MNYINLLDHSATTAGFYPEPYLFTKIFFIVIYRNQPKPSEDVLIYIPDEELAELTVKELNKKVQNLPRDKIRKLKEKRRTLKNRG